MGKEEVLKKIKEMKVETVYLQFTDILGSLKSVAIPAERMSESFEKGTWFDGSSIEGFTRIHESDMYLKPDPETFIVLPWKEGSVIENKKRTAARIMTDVYNPKGEPFEGDPRNILKEVLKEAKSMGLTYNVGPELEFFLFKPNNELKPSPHDIGGYFDDPSKDLALSIRNDITSVLKSFGFEIEMAHHEVAPGQHEIDFEYGDALTTADRAITLKYVVKSIAQMYGLEATFMPKPIFGQNGSGMHVHQSLFSGDSNVFFNSNNEYKLSETALYFIGGQLKHVKGFSAITSPTVNSYKRLVPGYEAPVYICWGQINRSALIRIPRYSPGREKATRAELRCPDPSCNPYLAFAVMLKSGLDGIKNKINPGKPVNEDVYEFDDTKLKDLNIDTLPVSLGRALDEMEKDGIVKSALGDYAYNKFLEAKRKEFADYKLQVTPWELEKYIRSI